LQRPLPDNTQHSQETDIHAFGGIPTTIPGSARVHTHALDRAAIAIGTEIYYIDTRESQMKTVKVR